MTLGACRSPRARLDASDTRGGEVYAKPPTREVVGEAPIAPTRSRFITLHLDGVGTSSPDTAARRCCAALLARAGSTPAERAAYHPSSAGGDLRAAGGRRESGSDARARADGVRACRPRARDPAHVVAQSALRDRLPAAVH